MNVLMLLTKIFRNDPRVYYEAEALTEAGHDVTVLVWARHDQEHELPDVEEHDGIEVHHLHLTEADSQGLPDNPLFGNMMWWKKAYEYGVELHERGKDFDVVHCHDLDTLMPGVKMKKKLGMKLVYDAHEIFGLMIRKDRSEALAQGALQFEKVLASNADHIITTSRPFYEHLDKVTDRPLTIVMNCKPLPSKEYEPPSNDVPTFSYIGLLHGSRMFPKLVDIFGEMDNVRFRIAGKKENLYEEVKERSSEYSNVEFLGSIPYSDVIPETKRSDVVVCPIDPDDPNSSLALANKQFEAMVCGRPIIVSDDTHAGEVTKEWDCGLVVEHAPESIKEAVERLRDDGELREELGKNAFSAAVKKFNWEHEKSKLISIYEELERGDQ